MCINHAIDKHTVYPRNTIFLELNVCACRFRKDYTFIFNVHGAFGIKEYQQILLTCGNIPFLYIDTINFIICDNL